MHFAVQVETIFHEMGHGVNSVLCRNRLQHLFGARGALDVVEIPSHVLERISRSSDVITKLLSPSTDSHASAGQQMLSKRGKKHLSLMAIGTAGEPSVTQPSQLNVARHVPENGAGTAAAGRAQRVVELRQHFCKHLNALDALVMPRLDCALHGPDPPDSVRKLRALVHSVSEEVMGCEVPLETYARLSIHHLVTYGGMCHAYPYAEAIAELLWERHLQQDVRNSAAGQALAEAVFVPGGALDAAEALEQLCPGVVEPVAGGFCPVVA